MKQKIEKKTELYRQEIIDTLCELIEVRTENPTGLNYKACFDYLSKKIIILENRSQNYQITQWKISSFFNSAVFHFGGIKNL